MTAIGEDFRTWLLADATVASFVGSERVHQARVPQGPYNGAYIWFRKSSTNDEMALDDAVGEPPFDQFFDVEFVSESMDEADDLAEAARALGPATGVTLGSGTAQVVRFQDHAEDYITRNDSSDDGRFVSALECHIRGYQQGA